MSCNRRQTQSSSTSSYSYSYSNSNGVQTSFTSSSGDSSNAFEEMQKKFSQLQNPSAPQAITEKNIPQNSNDFEAEALEIHNKYRAQHGVPPLQLDHNLCKFSEEWARNLASRGVMQHRSNSKYGENLYCKYGTGQIDATALDATKSWYDEIKHFNFSKPGFSAATGHFTQVIWRETQKLGVAKAKNANGQVFIVANYDPPGNVMGQFPENVPQVGSKLSERVIEKTNVEEVPRPLEDDASTLEYTRFQVESLHAHNSYRSKHSAPPMKLNKHLCDFAQEWANKLLRMNTMQHRPNNKYGENIYAKWGTGNLSVTGKEPVKSWYDEIKLYNFNRPGFSSGTGHFTQVVWIGSRELGVGIAQSKSAIYVVANYNPHGNVQGQFPANVKPR